MKSQRGEIGRIIRILRKRYPSLRVSLKHKDVFQLLVATILSARCTDERINKITPALFRRYRTIRAFAGLKRSKLEKDIRSAGFYRNKAKNIIAASQKILRDFNGRVPDSMKDLVTLAGVARKTANIVLSGGFGKAEGIAVDTHVKRLSRRLGFSEEKTPDKVEKDLMALVPKKYWLDFNYLLVRHGREVCAARKPLCFKCVINKLCPSAGIFYPALIL